MTSFNSSKTIDTFMLIKAKLCVRSICEDCWIEMKYLLFEHQEGEMKIKTSYSQSHKKVYKIDIYKSVKHTSALPKSIEKAI